MILDVTKPKTNAFRPCILAVVFLLLGSVVGSAEPPTSIRGFESPFTDPLPAFLSSHGIWKELGDPTQPLDKILDRVYELEYLVPYGSGKQVFVTEYLTLRSVLRRPTRAAIFLTAAEYRGDFWAVPVEGRNIPAMAAKRGFFAYTIDYLGMGNSYKPEDGSSVDYLTNAEPVDKLIDLIRIFRGVAKVDLVAEGFGGEVAATFAGDTRRIRSIVMSSVWYKNFSDGFRNSFLTPQFRAFLESQPGGYWVPNFVAQTLTWTDDQRIRDYVFATQQDLEVATGPFLQYFDPGLPLMDAAAAKVPALIMASEFSGFPAPGDVELLAAEWGGDATLVTLENSFHVPRIESPENAERYSDELFGFIDP